MAEIKTVFTNGCFDLLHRGHLELLHACRNAFENTHVIVGLNSDVSVLGLKSDGRPINNQADRQFFLEQLRDVDEVRIFKSEQDLFDLIKDVQPDLLVKGGDYEPEDVVGYGVCPISIFNCVDFTAGAKYSTTDLISRIKRLDVPDIVA